MSWVSCDLPSDCTSSETRHTANVPGGKMCMSNMAGTKTLLIQTETLQWRDLAVNGKKALESNKQPHRLTVLSSYVYSFVCVCVCMGGWRVTSCRQHIAHPLKKTDIIITSWTDGKLENRDKNSLFQVREEQDLSCLKGPYQLFCKFLLQIICNTMQYCQHFT